MHDNARRQHLAEVEIPVMAWLVRSADLNPIEHLWDELKKKVSARNAPPTSLRELQTTIKEEWDSILQEFIKKNSTMKHRMKAVIQARGVNTSY
ncbi:unnamed protein product [Euphydryas editha]|uniref:Tc1-like transposase DDE domain-containing protein n=1 Tax=Euphydryas editha TaxID=104508 RepID=A0AAU9VEM9_EUPED|nr:unnamed protein product [Euphydryas editha]